MLYSFLLNLLPLRKSSQPSRAICISSWIAITVASSETFCIFTLSFYRRLKGFGRISHFRDQVEMRVQGKRLFPRSLSSSPTHHPLPEPHPRWAGSSLAETNLHHCRVRDSTKHSWRYKDIVSGDVPVCTPVKWDFSGVIQVTMTFLTNLAF